MRIYFGEDADDCLRIEHKVKAMYGVRSSIVHSGSSSVDDLLLQDFLDLIRKIIFKVVNLKVSLDLKCERTTSDAKEKKIQWSLVIKHMP